MKQIAALLALIIPFISFNQVYVKPIPLGVFTQGSCTNTVVCEQYNMPEHGWVWLVDEYNSGIEIEYVDNLDTITNFCDPNYSFDMYSSNGYMSHYQLYSSVVHPHLNYNVASYTAPTAGQDGQIVLSFDSLAVLSDYEFWISQDNFYEPDTSILGPNTLSINNLNDGYLSIHITNPLDGNDHLNFRFYIGNPNDIYVNTGLDVHISLQHSSSISSCDGWIALTTPNATGNIYNVWCPAPYCYTANEMMRYNLCPDIYTIYTYEMIGGANVGASIDTLVLADNNTAYIDSSIYTNTIQDTSYVNFQDCQFDFNAAIDSVSYSEDTLFNNGTLLVVNFEMIMYQDQNFVSVSDSLVMINDSLILLDVVIYCDQFKAGFKSRRIAYMRGVDEHNFVQNGLGLSDNNHLKTQLYPNPCQDKLTIQLAHASTDIKVRDCRGAIVDVNSNSIDDKVVLDVSALQNGMYFVEISSESGIETIRFVKND